jgi:HSP20 family molecular chaperone IbpA
MLADDPRGRMWSEACDMLERAERLHRQFFRPGLALPQSASWEPPVDIFETAERLWIIAALPGVAPEQIEASIATDELTIVGSRPLPAAARGAAIHRLEIPYGRFERRVRLPAGRFELELSELVSGCLVLSLIRKG